MKYQQQAHNECLLAATCNALDLDLVETRKLLRQFLIKEGLFDFGKPSSLPDSGLWNLLFQYGLIDAAARFLSKLGLESTAETIAQPFFVLGLDPSSADLSGKGILSVQLHIIVDGNQCFGHHAISYENGKLLDPFKPSAGTFTLETMHEFFQREFPDRIVTRVVLLNVTPQRKDKDNQ